MRPQVVCNLFPAVQCDAQSHWSKLACNVTQRRKVGGVSAAKVKNQHFARSFLRRLPSRPTLPHTCQRCSHAQCSRPNLSHLQRAECKNVHNNRNFIIHSDSLFQSYSDISHGWNGATRFACLLPDGTHQLIPWVDHWPFGQR